jgi:hypothetical protein
MPKQPSITRRQFIQKYVDSGMTYEQAGKAYEATCQLFADAVTAGQKICIGNVLAITPIKRPPRAVTSGLGGVKKTIYLTSRICFKTKVYRKFLDGHSLSWAF